MGVSSVTSIVSFCGLKATEFESNVRFSHSKTLSACQRKQLPLFPRDPVAQRQQTFVYTISPKQVYLDDLVILSRTIQSNSN